MLKKKKKLLLSFNSILWNGNGFQFLLKKKKTHFEESNIIMYFSSSCFQMNVVIKENSGGFGKLLKFTDDDVYNDNYD